MDRSWIDALRTSDEYERGVDQFLEFAKNNVPNNNGLFYCPCVKCMNGLRQVTTEIKDHLICFGFYKAYRQWVLHGESKKHKVCQIEKDDMDMDERVEDMIHDVGVDVVEQLHKYSNLCNDAEKPLYPGCTKYTRLTAVLKLVNLKAKNGWSNKSFTELLILLKDMLPEGNILPDRNYEAKKILCPMGLGYKKIHACPNDCVLYRKAYDELDACPVCGTSRYKVKEMEGGDVISKGPPAKVLWYLPIIPRFKRLFANANEAKKLRWHVEERKTDGMLRHPADSSQWKRFNQLFSEFSNEPRNLRLGLCTDGMNPYGNLNSQHSSWPVLLVIYNLPPWLCMKRKYIMLYLMISGPRQPGNDIDVYLAPLIDDLKMMWEVGVDVFDAYHEESFKLRAMIFCTINDFPAYGNLSGYSVKGHNACPICEDRTSHQQLSHGKKTVYLGHRRFLEPGHPYRRKKKEFNGFQEYRDPPEPLTADQVYERVKDIDTVLGKSQKRVTEKNLWKKKSIFFDLPYWKYLEVKHSIDVMHVEKNVCESLIGTLLNIKGKSKDGKKARLDLLEMGIRTHLGPRTDGKRTYMPPAYHTLSKREKKSFCQCLQSIKVPQGYSSNIKKLVSMKDLKLVGMKSHDYHILMQQFLPIAIRDILEKKVRNTIIRLCSFFNAICSKVIDPEKLDELQNDIVITLCQLEMYFVPSFFDIMVHLIIHLVREIKLCGPVYLRWMYPFERYMKILKGYVKNPHRPEASIVERYVAEEVVEFCTEYLSGIKPIGLPESRHKGMRVAGQGTRGFNVRPMKRDDVEQAHMYILNNIDEVQDYLFEHKEELRVQNPKKADKWLLSEHNKCFSLWFKAKVKQDRQKFNVSDTVRWLASGPNYNVTTWSGYDINGYSFYTKYQDDKSTMQNSGVMVVAEAMHFSSSKDKNPKWASMQYFGIIEEIWEIDYYKFKVPIFKCKWVDSNNGVKIDMSSLALINLNKVGHKEDPFIMAVHAKQVFYVTDPIDKNWSVVLHGKSLIAYEENDESYCDIGETPLSMSTMPQLDEEDKEDGVHSITSEHGDKEDDMYGVRTDHDEGLWET
ncbi:uncharacterized protein LOC114717527 [Neltuma alba]|uniref:uncharacterized protein LOC114717527 n=1 Tax=Neltuma alba TaxID=207710 RepID=UPI0010A563DF|nr:uncharacterized protein LOC114717527 [Prosopis alba]